MNFKEATDGLFDRISHEDLAEALGSSVASIRQARLNRKARAYREPPLDWQRAVLHLLEQRIGRYRKLVENVGKAEVFKRSGVVKWHCINCGYVFEGAEPPRECPACRHPQTFYELLAENY